MNNDLIFNSRDSKVKTIETQSKKDRNRPVNKT